MAHRLTIPLVLGFLLLLAGCASQPPVTTVQPRSDYDLLLTLPGAKISYSQSVRPILTHRCVVCHGCYDAPCQLKLSSYEGVQRGASPVKVYDGTRFQSIESMRLGIDAKSVAEWRSKGFHAVLNEDGKADAAANLDESVLYYMLRLKEQHPQPRTGGLPDSVDVGIDREQVCTSRADFSEFAKAHPLWGMPYGLPNLSSAEYATLVHWIAQGAPGAADKPISAQVLPQVERWERLLNGQDNKQRLVSRYIYEHLIQAHIHFRGSADDEFYRLIRSYTPPGEAADEIPTVRPYDDPGARFYYRLLRYQPQIVDKDHLPYEWSDARMRRYRELFLDPDYRVETLPGYEAPGNANPFKVFEAIPPLSRYQFLLDDAHFFIEGFIKGPVCRGQIAVNVIEDQFWVFFVRPDATITTLQPNFIAASADYLNLPAEQGDNSLRILATWLDYLQRQKKYLASKNLFLQARFDSNDKALDINTATDLLWDGGGSNRNAALTIFRNFDSASVDYGLVGDYPETAWVIDYPIFERIHYLLVAGFNVYGNLTHQLNTRLYMDFLRMEAENQFLLFMPAAQREAIRDRWYQGMQEGVWNELKDSQAVAMSLDTVKGYRSNDPEREFFQIMERKMGHAVVPPDTINRCEGAACSDTGKGLSGRVETAMRRLASQRGSGISLLPDVSFIHIHDPAGNDLAYSLILNKGYSNITSMFEDEDRRDRSQDTLTVVRGLEGAYPNFFFRVDADRLEDFVQRISALQNDDDLAQLVGLYGIRRTNSAFWEESDWFYGWARRADPGASGIYDYNRYWNL